MRVMCGWKATAFTAGVKRRGQKASWMDLSSFLDEGPFWCYFLCYIRVPYYVRDLKWDPNLENYPYESGNDRLSAPPSTSNFLGPGACLAEP